MSDTTPSAQSNYASYLRWYPTSWRARYGDELLAMVEDTLDGEPAPARFRASLLWGGLRQHVRQTFGNPPSAAPADRHRAGARLVLCAWALFVFAGCAFAKLTEHWQSAMPAAHQRIPADAYNALVAFAGGAAACIAAAGIVAMPALVREVRRSGWQVVRRPGQAASCAVAAFAVATTGLVAWAHGLTDHQRNSGFGAYQVAFVAWVALFAVVLVIGTAVAAHTERKLRITRRVADVEAALAVGVALSLVAMTVAAAVWWTSMAAHAPWFLHGTRPTTAASGWSPEIAVVMGLMLAAVAAATTGVTRMRSPRHR